MMHSIRTSRGWMLTALASMAILLGACATSPGRVAKDTRSVEERAAERAQLFAAGEFSKAWTYTTPGYRAAVTLDNYVAKSEVQPIKWLKAEFVSSDCEADANTCNAKIDVEFQNQIPMRYVGRLTLNHQITESWLKIDGVWYFLPPDFR